MTPPRADVSWRKRERISAFITTFPPHSYENRTTIFPSMVESNPRSHKGTTGSGKETCWSGVRMSRMKLPCAETFLGCLPAGDEALLGAFSCLQVLSESLSTKS